MAMLSRGFTGEFPLHRPLGIGPADIAFTVFWCLLFMGLRFVNLPQVLGKLIMGGIS
jgi:cobalt/nickel transport system permease protein